MCCSGIISVLAFSLSLHSPSASDQVDPKYSRHTQQFVEWSYCEQQGSEGNCGASSTVTEQACAGLAEAACNARAKCSGFAVRMLGKEAYGSTYIMWSGQTCMTRMKYNDPHWNLYLKQPSEVGCDQKLDYSSKSWRVLASRTRSGWAWDIMQLNIVTANGNMGTFGSSNGCDAIQSGSVSDAGDGITGYEPRNAFRTDGTWWGGRKNTAGEFYLGFECTESQVVRSVEILQGASLHSQHVADSVILQYFDGNAWVSVHTARLHEVNRMEMFWKSCWSGATVASPYRGVDTRQPSSPAIEDAKDGATPMTVSGFVRLSISSLEGASAIGIIRSKQHKDFLTTTIANTYGISSTNIIEIALARRLSAVPVSRIQIRFEGIGTVDQVASSAFKQSLQVHFKKYGLEIHDASIQFSTLSGSTGRTQETDKLAMVIFILSGVTGICFLAFLLRYAMRQRRFKKEVAVLACTPNQIVVVAVEPNPVIEPNPSIVDAKTNAGDEDGTSSWASTRTPSSGHGEDEDKFGLF